MGTSNQLIYLFVRYFSKKGMIIKHSVFIKRKVAILIKLIIHPYVAKPYEKPLLHHLNLSWP